MWKNKEKIIKEEDKKSIIEKYNEGYSVAYIYKNLFPQYSKDSLYNLIKSNCHYRSRSEQVAISHKLMPMSFKMSNKAKEKLRKFRLNYMKKHPENTAWRKRNKPSYPEQLFINLIKKLDLDKKFLIEREYCIFPYYIDFAFKDIKVAFEIDGSQHWLNKERKESDIKKDNLLKSKGWRICRIKEYELKDNFENVESKVLDFIGNIDIKYLNVGLVNRKPKYLIDKENRIKKKEEKIKLKIKKEKELVEKIKSFNDIDFKKPKWCFKISQKIGFSQKYVKTILKKHDLDFYIHLYHIKRRG